MGCKEDIKINQLGVKSACHNHTSDTRVSPNSTKLPPPITPAMPTCSTTTQGFVYAVKITRSISSLCFQNASQNLLHLCYGGGRIFYLIFDTWQTLFITC